MPRWRALYWAIRCQYRGLRLAMDGYSREMVDAQIAEDTAAKKAQWLGLPIPGSVDEVFTRR